MERIKIDSFQAIVVNYFAATILGLAASGSNLSEIIPEERTGIILGLTVGIIFILVFF